MYRWEKINEIIHKILQKNKLYDSEDYCTFTRPDNHIIYECRSEKRDEIVRVLRANGFSVIENDKWCGCRRIGIIVDHFYEEIKEDCI